MKQPPLQLNSGFHTKMGMEMQTGEIDSEQCKHDASGDETDDTIHIDGF